MRTRKNPFDLILKHGTSILAVLSSLKYDFMSHDDWESKNIVKIEKMLQINI